MEGLNPKKRRRRKGKEAVKAKKFLKRNHSDANMLVAIRIRPMAVKEVAAKDLDIISAEDKLLIVLD